MSRLARLVVRRRRLVIVAWLALLIATTVVGSSAFSVLSSDFGAGTTTESGRVAHRLDDLAQTGGQIAIIANAIDIDDPAVQRNLGEGLADIAALDGVLSVADPWSSGIDALRSTDGRAALVVVTMAGDLSEDDELAVAKRVEAMAHSLDAPEVLVGGNVLVGETFATASERDLLRGEAIAL
ncbi:MAG: MMPL family transporter, partial [Mycobacterium sp.]